MISNLKDFYASDSLEINISNSDYKASDGFLCRVRLLNSNPEAAQDWLANADGDNFIISKQSTETSIIPIGRFKVFYVFFKNDTGFLKSLDGGMIEVKPDLTTITSFDFETYNYKALQAVCQRISGHWDDDFASFAMDGKSITKMNGDELIRAKEYFEKKVNEELKITTAKKTGVNKNTMRIVFDAPWRF